MSKYVEAVGKGWSKGSNLDCDTRCSVKNALYVQVWPLQGLKINTSLCSCSATGPPFSFFLSSALCVLSASLCSLSLLPFTHKQRSHFIHHLPLWNPEAFSSSCWSKGTLLSNAQKVITVWSSPVICSLSCSPRHAAKHGALHKAEDEFTELWSYHFSLALWLIQSVGPCWSGAYWSIYLLSLPFSSLSCFRPLLQLDLSHSPTPHAAHFP